LADPEVLCFSYALAEKDVDADTGCTLLLPPADSSLGCGLAIGALMDLAPDELRAGTGDAWLLGEAGPLSAVLETEETEETETTRTRSALK
jgi:hypothetical protein